MIGESHLQNANFYNLYGPAETTLTSIYRKVSIGEIEQGTVAIGIPFANVQIQLTDIFDQSVMLGQEGELLIGGHGVFAGYLGRDDLNQKALVNINGKQFYRTGDLARMNSEGLLYYLGRKDHQIKLHGQRIELGEIERCLLNITSISACVVMKWGEDHLVAYVQSDYNDTAYFRDCCRSQLPLFMVPSMFIPLKQFPQNANGKLDRKQLPSPNSALTIESASSTQSNSPQNALEQHIHDIWCEIFRYNGKQISTRANFFSVGGHSLLFIELYHRYQSKFLFNNEMIPISSFLVETTIADHAKLIQAIDNNECKEETWYPLHLIEGIASFAQERIYLDQQIRFMDNVSVYNELVVLKLIDGTLSRDRLERAIRSVLEKHRILRTSLILDTNLGRLVQCVTQNHLAFTVNIGNTYTNEAELGLMISQTKSNVNIFDLSNGCAFYCEIIRKNPPGERIDREDLIGVQDVIVFAVHHAAYDRASRQIFFADLITAYESDEPLLKREDIFQYIDFSTYEREMDMTSASQFWRSYLDGYQIKCQLPFLIDRQQFTNNQRSGLSINNKFSFDNKSSDSFLSYASSHDVTPFQLGLTIFYAFLLKLTNNNTDLCVGCISANRYRTELQNLIGMFVATLPYRVTINPYDSFGKLVEQVREKCFAIIQHSHYPLQRILADINFNQSNLSLFQTVFDFITESHYTNDLSIRNVKLEPGSSELYEIFPFDFGMTFQYNALLVDNQLSGFITCSRDLFDEATVKVITRRFQHFCQQLFSSEFTPDSINMDLRPIFKFDPSSPDEDEEPQLINFCQQKGIKNEGLLLCFLGTFLL
ncbi:unnamed protein product [Adineta ricciae]|uniref:Carrier domain-containing protein n=1 Tax=Adineta ricciae TaxID=249248 RepID=A0A815CAD3_ADIRI|nr:unnamed protein product [Adineta ricciae]